MQGLFRQQLDFIEFFNFQIPQFPNCSIPESFSPSILINNIPRRGLVLQNGNQKRQPETATRSGNRSGKKMQELRNSEFRESGINFSIPQFLNPSTPIRLLFWTFWSGCDQFAVI